MQKEQKFGLSFEELATRETVYRDNLLKDHSVLITGAGSGMGKAMAFLFARLGANVTVCGRKEDKLIKVYDEILNRCGKEIFWQVSNVRDPEMVEKMLDNMLERNGKIDTVINNAGRLKNLPAPKNLRFKNLRFKNLCFKNLHATKNLRAKKLKKC